MKSSPARRQARGQPAVADLTWPARRATARRACAPPGDCFVPHDRQFRTPLVTGSAVTARTRTGRRARVGGCPPPAARVVIVRRPAPAA